PVAHAGQGGAQSWPARHTDTDGHLAGVDGGRQPRSHGRPDGGGVYLDHHRPRLRHRRLCGQRGTPELGERTDPRTAFYRGTYPGGTGGQGSARMSRFLKLPPADDTEQDPLAGIANLFDVSVVFIVGLMISLFSVYRMGDLVNPDTEVTMVMTNAQGEQEIITKRGTEIEAYRVTADSLAGGDGERLGIAYRLPDGQVIYVPEGGQQGTTP